MNRTMKWMVGGAAALMLGALVYAVPAVASGTPMMNGHHPGMMSGDMAAKHQAMMTGDNAAMHEAMMTGDNAAMHEECLNGQGTADDSE